MPHTLQPSAVVVRGGTKRDFRVVLEDVRDAIEDGDGPVLSVYCMNVGPEASASAVHQACVQGDVPHTQIQVSSVEKLEAAGFSLHQHSLDGEPACHHHVEFGNDLRRERVETFIGCFDQPIPNPTGGKRRRR